MNKELGKDQAKLMLDYLKNSSGKETSNFEILCGLALCFAHAYLTIIVNEKQ
jgi:hypothetical protein